MNDSQFWRVFPSMRDQVQTLTRDVIMSCSSESNNAKLLTHVWHLSHLWQHKLTVPGTSGTADALHSSHVTECGFYFWTRKLHHFLIFMHLMESFWQRRSQGNSYDRARLQSASKDNSKKDVVLFPDWSTLFSGSRVHMGSWSMRG